MACLTHSSVSKISRTVVQATSEAMGPQLLTFPQRRGRQAPQTLPEILLTASPWPSAVGGLGKLKELLQKVF